jgi:hypothetical protein
MLLNLISPLCAEEVPSTYPSDDRESTDLGARSILELRVTQRVLLRPGVGSD